METIESSYLDSFKINLPSYIIKSELIIEKLDSIIFFVENCNEFQQKSKDFPMFIYLEVWKNSFISINIKASRNHVFNLAPSGFFRSKYRDEDYVGVVNFRGYKVFLIDNTSLEPIDDEPILLPFLSVTGDTLSFSAFGLRKKDTNEWLLMMDLPSVMALYRLNHSGLINLSWLCYPNVKKPWPCGHPVEKTLHE